MDESLQNEVTINLNNIEFKENDIMTNYEGYWIQKSRVRMVNGMYHKFYRKAAANKHVVTDEQKQTKLNRYMKKLLRNEHRMLKMALTKNKAQTPKDEISENKVLEDEISKNRVPEYVKSKVPEDEISKNKVPDDEISKTIVLKDKVPMKAMYTGEMASRPLPNAGKEKKPGKYLGINYKDDPDIVMFEGFYVHKRSIDRLNQIKDELTQKGLSAEDLRKELRRKCRKEERLVKKEKKSKLL